MLNETNCDSKVNQSSIYRMDAWTRVWRREGEMAQPPSEAVVQPTTGWDAK